MNNPSSVSLDQERRVIVADRDNHRVIRLSGLRLRNSADNLLIPGPGGREVYEMSSAGRHLRTIDAQTGVAKYLFAYNDAGDLTSIEDVNGLVTEIERDFDGNPVAIVGPFGQRTTVELNPDGYLERLIGPDGNDVVFAYSGEDGLLTSYQDPNREVKTYEYDSMGRFVRETDAVGGSQRVSTEESAGILTTTFVDAEGRETVSTFERDGGMTTKTVTEPWGGTMTTVRDLSGNQSFDYPDGSSTVRTISASGQFGQSVPTISQSTVTLPSGLAKTVSRSAEIVLNDPGDPMSLETSTEYFDVNGRVAVSEYDKAAGVKRTISPEGRTNEQQLDEQGRIVELRASGQLPVSLDYDAIGRIASMTQGDRVQSWRYYNTSDSMNGYLHSQTDALDRTTYFIPDEFGRTVSQILPDGREIGYSYDAVGNLTSITPPGKPTHDFDYTPVNLVEAYEPPALSGVANVTTQYAYNLAGQVDLITRPDGQVIDYVYDDAGRISEVLLGDDGQLTYTYNETNGKLATLTSPDAQTIAYSYDGSLLTGTTETGTVAGSVTFGYNNDFAVISESINSNDTVAFARDDDGLLEQAGEMTLSHGVETGFLEGTSLESVASSYSYNDYGELQEEAYSVSGSTVYDVDYVRDELGRITEKTEMIQGETTTYGYAYDLAGRLTDVYLNGDTQPIAHYDYDDNGNRVSYSDFREVTPVVQNGTFDDQDRMLTYGNAEDGYAAFAYSDNGELETKTLNGEVTDYEYDVLGNLKHVTLPDGMAVDYIVDGENRRVGKVVDGVLEMGLLYRDALNPVAELDELGNVVSRFVYGSKSNVPDYFTSNKMDGATWQTYRIISNHLGSPRLVVNTATGEVVQRIDYDEYGRVLEDTNPGFQPFGFAGGIYDPDTGLVRFGARDYDAETGRWTAKDPIRFRGGDTNLYGYVLADPINYTDMWGLLNDFNACAIVAVGVGGLVGLFTGVGPGIVVGGLGMALCAANDADDGDELYDTCEEKVESIKDAELTDDKKKALEEVLGDDAATWRGGHNYGR